MTLLTFPQLETIVNASLANIAKSYPNFYPFFQTLYTFGLRPIELIEISRISEFGLNWFVVNTAKGSNNRQLDRNYCNKDFTQRVINGDTFYYPELLSVPKGFGIRIMNKEPYVLIYENLLPDIKISMTEVVRINQVKPLDMYIFRHYRIKEMSIVQGMLAKEIARYFGEVNVDNIQGYIDSKLYI